MINIRSISRLIAATHAISSNPTLAENQVGRIRDRLINGVDVDGNPFAPYKNPRVKRENQRPLQQAARLFESPSYSNDQSFSSTDFKFSITGQAAKIAIYQNMRRRFLGFSRKDRLEVRQDFMEALSLAWRSSR